jgi:hypothetical protein
VAALREFTDIEAKFKTDLPDIFRTQYEARQLLPEFGDEKPFRFDLLRGQCWVTWRAVDLGWDKELHGKAERYFPDRADRTSHSVERIGKKYQWIAYNELCGYLIDHHWYFSDLADVDVPFDRVDDFDRRDIDPSLWPADQAEVRPDSRIPPLAIFETNFHPQSVGAAIAWTKTSYDLLRPLDIIEAVDANGQRWWATHLWYRDTSYLDKHQTTTAFQTAQAAINMIVLQQTDIDKFVQAARGRNFGNDHMLGGGEVAARFVGENAWDSGILAHASGDQIHLTDNYHGVPYCIPTMRLGTKRGEYDLSSTIDKSITSPNLDLVRAKRMHVEGPRKFAFIQAGGCPIFIDVEVTCPSLDRTIVHATALESVLARQGLCPLWIFWSEKDGGLGSGLHFASRDAQFSRTIFGGCYWRSNGIWETSGLWLIDSN